MERAKIALPPYIVPREIHVLTEMPLNSNGKVDRKALRERLLAGDLGGGRVASVSLNA